MALGPGPGSSHRQTAMRISQTVSDLSTLPQTQDSIANPPPGEAPRTRRHWRSKAGSGGLASTLSSGATVAHVGDPLHNPRWEAFARACALQGMAGPAAYLHIGGTGNSVNQGKKLRQRPEIKERIKELQERAIDNALAEDRLTREYVLAEAMENIDTAKVGRVTYQGKTVYLTRPSTAEEVEENPDIERNVLVLDSNGDPIPLEKRDHSAIQRTIEMLGRELGMFPNNAKIEHSKSKPFEGLTTEQILLEAQAQFEGELGFRIEMGDLFKLIEAARGGELDGKPELPSG